MLGGFPIEPFYPTHVIPATGDPKKDIKFISLLSADFILNLQKPEHLNIYFVGVLGF